MESETFLMRSTVALEVREGDGSGGGLGWEYLLTSCRGYPFRCRASVA